MQLAVQHHRLYIRLSAMHGQFPYTPKQKSGNQMTETPLVSLILMRCESHISNSISICHFTLFSTLTPCMLMPTQTWSAGASRAGSTYLVWLQFWREAQRQCMSSEFTQGLCQFQQHSNGNHRDPGLIQQNAALYYTYRSRSVFPF